jgi:Pretoxin HINT domain
MGLGTRTGPSMTDRQFREMEENQRQAIQRRLVNFASNSAASPSGAAVGRLGQAIERGSLAPFNNVTNAGSQIPGGPIRYTPVYDEELQIQVPIGEMVLETQISAAVAQQQLANDVAALENANNGIRRTNDSVLMALKTITGGELGDDGAAWNKWWTDQLGYASTATSTAPVPTFVENVPIGYTPTATSTFVITDSLIGYERTQHHSCFAAGTAVRTIDGDRRIESIRAGDLVLVQDTKTGALGYQPVVAAYHNPPSPTLKVKLGEADAVVATGIHRFWKAGKGWTMARDLKVGDLVRTLGGVAKVSAVENDRTQPVFNLEVAEGRSFLVGKLGVLVHDNSLVEATPAPFDAGSMAAK